MPFAATTPSRWHLFGVLALVLAGLGVFSFVFVPDRSSARLLVDTATTVEVLPDPARTQHWPAVRTQSGWQRFTSRGYVHAEPRAAVWLRLTLRNATAQTQHAVLVDADFITDEITLYAPSSENAEGWQVARTGQSVAAAEKPITGRAAALPVTLPPHSETVFYLHAVDHFETWLQLWWWPEARAFHAAELRTTMADTFFFGILAALFFYNGVLWSRLRYRDLGYYLAYLAATACFIGLARAMDQAAGFAVPTPRYEPLVSGCIASVALTLVLFAREFLALHQVAPRLERLARYLIALNVATALGSISMLWSRDTAWMHVVIAVATLTHACTLFAAVIAWRRGLARAKFFVLSFSILLVCSIPMSTQWLLAIPFGNTFLGTLLGSALEMLLLSLALSERFAQLQRERYEARFAEEAARLETLRYQLNPHFLFNALNSIYGLVLPHSAAAGDLVRRLSDFCRSTLIRPRGSWQTLADEFAMLRSYLDIEQARWRENLVIATELDPAVDSFQIPPFLLLPLVENAIKHGGASSPEVLTLRLTARRETDGSLLLTVTNSGVWQPASTSRASAAPFGTSTGTGLTNLRERLARAYGPTASLTTSASDGWVTLTLRLPSPFQP